MFSSPSARIGRLLVAIGAVAMVAALAATAIAWRLVDRGAETLEASLDVTVDAVATMDSTVAVTLETLQVAETSLGTLRSTLEGAEPTLGNIGAVVGGISEMASSEIPDALDEMVVVLGAVAGAANALNDGLEALSRFGVGGGSGPDVGDSLGVVQARLAEVSSTLRTQGGNLRLVSEEFASLGDDAGLLSDDVAAIADNVTEAGDLLAAYEETAADAGLLVGETRNDIDRRRQDLRLLVALLGVVLVAASLTPLLLGRHIVRATTGALETDVG